MTKPTFITRLVRRLRADRGQAIIMFVGIFTVAIFLGAVTIDFGLWFSERRGAQKDADLAALAGALELLEQVDYNDPLNPSVVPAAESATYALAAENEIAPEFVHNLTISTDCFSADDGVYDSVSLDVEHESRSLFWEAFAGLAGSAVPDPTIGAHARACMGSPSEARGLLPIGVQVAGQDSDCFEDWDNDGIEEPLFGVECKLGYGAGDQTSGEGGILRLFDDGSVDCSAPNTGGGNTVRDEIEGGGADTRCSVAPPGTTSADCTTDVSYCVWPKTTPGATNPIQGALNTLLIQDGECDAMYGPQVGSADGIDDFLEVVEPVNGDLNSDPGTTTYEKRDGCWSPRLVLLVILDSFSANGNDPSPIRAFASFFLKGCFLDGVPEPYCEQQGSVGQTELWGFFLNFLNVGTLGPVNEFGQRGIALVE